jgi:hypothetical protein
MLEPVEQEHQPAEGWICTDCMMLLANGDASGIEDDQLEIIEQAWDEIDCHVSPGTFHDDCDWHGMDDYDDVTACETQEFSWSRCDICDRESNAGTRHAVTFWVNG